MKLELVPVPVTDVDRAKAFYVDQVGFQPTMTTASPMTCASCSSPRLAPHARSS
jgi:predicted enzyme related to lactoylglutathione lyase